MHPPVPMPNPRAATAATPVLRTRPAGEPYPQAHPRHSKTSSRAGRLDGIASKELATIESCSAYRGTPTISLGSWRPRAKLRNATALGTGAFDARGRGRLTTTPPLPRPAGPVTSRRGSPTGRTGASAPDPHLERADSTSRRMHSSRTSTRRRPAGSSGWRPGCRPWSTRPDC
jgi:hypothetical protein